MILVEMDSGAPPSRIPFYQLQSAPLRATEAAEGLAMKNLNQGRKINKSFDSELRIEKQFSTIAIRRRGINEYEITSASKSVCGSLYFPAR